MLARCLIEVERQADELYPWRFLVYPFARPRPRPSSVRVWVRRFHLRHIRNVNSLLRLPPFVLN